MHDSKAMDVIPYEQDSYYIFNRAYNDFRRLFKIPTIEAFFLVRAKKNLQYKMITWRRRLPHNVLSDAIVVLTGFYPKKHYPEHLRLIIYWDE